jgi:hypothetical protein
VRPSPCRNGKTSAKATAATTSARHSTVDQTGAGSDSGPSFPARGAAPDERTAPPPVGGTRALGPRCRGRRRRGRSRARVCGE